MAARWRAWARWKVWIEGIAMYCAYCGGIACILVLSVSITNYNRIVVKPAVLSLVFNSTKRWREMFVYAFKDSS